MPGDILTARVINVHFVKLFSMTSVSNFSREAIKINSSYVMYEMNGTGSLFPRFQQGWEKYSDQLSIFLVYGVLSFKSTPGFIKTTWFFLSWAERNPLKKQIFAVSSWCQIKKPDWLFCLGYWKTPSILTMLNVMGSSFLLFDVTVNISHGKFFLAKSSQTRHANFL